MITNMHFKTNNYESTNLSNKRKNLFSNLHKERWFNKKDGMSDRRTKGSQGSRTEVRSKFQELNGSIRHAEESLPNDKPIDLTNIQVQQKDLSHTTMIVRELCQLFVNNVNLC